MTVCHLLYIRCKIDALYNDAFLGLGSFRQKWHQLYAEVIAHFDQSSVSIRNLAVLFYILAYILQDIVPEADAIVITVCQENDCFVGRERLFTRSIIAFSKT